jgi:hypothetical protein
MAKLAGSGAMEKPKRSRPGVHSKTKTSRSKNATNYKKKYKGQGR